MEEDAPIDLETQVEFLKNVLEFNKKTSILGETPNEEEIEHVRELCKEIKVVDFDLEADNIEFLKQISKFATKYGGTYSPNRAHLQ